MEILDFVAVENERGLTFDGLRFERIVKRGYGDTPYVGDQRLEDGAKVKVRLGDEVRDAVVKLRVTHYHGHGGMDESHDSTAISFGIKFGTKRQWIEWQKDHLVSIVG
jgi:hypothetical protein